MPINITIANTRITEQISPEIEDELVDVDAVFKTTIAAIVAAFITFPYLLFAL